MSDGIIIMLFFYLFYFIFCVCVCVLSFNPWEAILMGCIMA